MTGLATVQLNSNLTLTCVSLAETRLIFKFARELAASDEFGILQCCGRFQNADISESAKYPQLLPRHEHFTKLLIQYVHERLIHAGASHTLGSLCQEYWIVKGRVEVKKVLSCCLVCR